ncbi:VTC domain-containing protein [Planktomarina temperata]|nr:VTC domain-containing protein [Planktomarina temperata]
MNIRKEKKYTFSVNNIHQVRSSIFNSSLAIRQTYKNRYVNSIYLDSINFDNYNENLAGLSQRSKARIRWYSREKCQHISSQTECILEVKSRSNVLGAKMCCPVKLPKNIEGLKANALINHIRNVIPIDFLPFIDHCNDCTLMVSYKREYYASFSNQIRVTVDSEISYSKPSINVFDIKLAPKYQVEYGVLEIKYPIVVEDDLNYLDFNNISISPGRHSKYAVGLNTVLG